MNEDAWWPVVGFASLGFVALAVAAGLALGKFQPWLVAIAGAFSLPAFLLSGYYARDTFVGADLVPWVIDLSPIFAILAYCLVLFAIVRGIMAAIPGKWSLIAVVPPLLVSVWLLPSAAPHMPDGEVTARLDRFQQRVTAALVERTPGWFE